mmetsp:Transcript_18807/g.54382  ORF Transcript_18807/g.54382 Transcript_18807/m.54382 type:complete len:257 (-) Transcript_18807:1125-1895(-)
MEEREKCFLILCFQRRIGPPPTSRGPSRHRFRFRVCLHLPYRTASESHSSSGRPWSSRPPDARGGLLPVPVRVRARSRCRAPSSPIGADPVSSRAPPRRRRDRGRDRTVRRGWWRTSGTRRRRTRRRCRRYRGGVVPPRPPFLFAVDGGGPRSGCPVRSTGPSPPSARSGPGARGRTYAPARPLLHLGVSRSDLPPFLPRPSNGWIETRRRCLLVSRRRRRRRRCAPPPSRRRQSPARTWRRWCGWRASVDPTLRS